MNEIIMTDKEVYDFNTHSGVMCRCPKCKNVFVRRYDNFCSKCGIKFNWKT